MAASPQVVTANPLYLTARTNIYTAQELRKPFDDSSPGTGVADYDSFRARQRVAGANQSVDVVAASALNRAWVRGQTITDQGMYRVDYINATILNLDIAAADPTNPRIDQIFLAVEDAQHAGSNNQATVRVVVGTATVGATLDNRTGAGAVPVGMSSILLADVLVPALSASVVTANIRDRRPVAGFGTVPWLGSTGPAQVDQVALMPSPMLIVAGGNGNIANAGAGGGQTDNQQLAALMYLPRRIVGATRIRWRYGQATTAASSNYVLAIYDASGRLIVGITPINFTGAALSVQTRSEVIAATTFEAGWYYVMIGLAVGTASSQVGSLAVGPGGSNSLAPLTTSLYLRSSTGGTTAPTTLLAFVDQSTVVAPGGGVPVVGLSVG